MKTIKYILIIITFCTVTSCKKDFIQGGPQGQLTEEQLTNQAGVEGLLTGAYGLLNGNVNGTWGNYAAAPSQWIFGEVASDNAHKGSVPGDQSPIDEIQRHTPISSNEYLTSIWVRCFEGIQRCNTTLKVLASLQGGSSSEPKFDDARATEITGEARLLRGHYYFFLVRVFKSVPYITEATKEQAIPNQQDIFPDIVKDMEAAVANLGLSKPKNQVGRVDKYIAQAYLGKVLLYQKKYAEAYELLNAVILAKPSLVSMPYTDNFDITKENGPESIFAVQHSVGADGTGGDNGNVGDMLNTPNKVACCGFFQPSLDLANAFKVDADGLPLLDGSYRINPYLSDFGITDSAERADYKVNVSLNFDPRIDYTMGRRGVEYRKGYGPMTGDAWVRGGTYAGPFVALKSVLDADQVATGTAPGLENVTGLNVNLIRLADIYLMAAECAVETGAIERAMELVNFVRIRAATLPPKMAASGVPAAAYKISPYTSFPSTEYARNAVRFERRLELALEGHRFFDLVRWEIVKPTMESYSSFEGSHIPNVQGIVMEPRDAYFPLPQDEIDRSRGILKQSPGY